MSVGKFLKELIKIKGVTQEQLSKDIGVDRPTISNWVRDANIPSNANFEKLAKYFDVPISKFLQKSEGDNLTEFNVGESIKRIAAVADVTLLAVAEILAKLNNRAVAAEVGALEDLVKKRINGEELNKSEEQE